MLAMKIYHEYANILRVMYIGGFADVTSILITSNPDRTTEALRTISKKLVRDEEVHDEVDRPRSGIVGQISPQLDVSTLLTPAPGTGKVSYRCSRSWREGLNRCHGGARVWTMTRRRSPQDHPGGCMTSPSPPCDPRPYYSRPTHLHVL